MSEDVKSEQQRTYDRQRSRISTKKIDDGMIIMPIMSIGNNVCLFSICHYYTSRRTGIKIQIFIAQKGRQGPTEAVRLRGFEKNTGGGIRNKQITTCTISRYHQYLSRICVREQYVCILNVISLIG